MKIPRFARLRKTAAPRPAIAQRTAQGPADPSPKKIYVEPSSRCNLACEMCIRHAWHEPEGDLAADTWQRLLSSLRGRPGEITVQFSGFGEPLLHEGLADMVRQASSRGIARSS